MTARAMALGGAGFDFDDPQWVSLRRNMGYTRWYADGWTYRP